MGGILLATDGSEFARRAAEHAVDLAAERGEPLHVICVVDERKFDGSTFGAGELATVYAEDHADLSVQEVANIAADHAVPVEGDTRRGIPHEVIVAYADEVGASAIVVGEHGDHDTHFSGVGRKVQRTADREVVVVEGGS